MSERDPSVLARELAAIVGEAQVRPPSRLEAPAVAIVAEPRNEAEVVELIRKCEADGLALAPIGAARTLAQIRLAPATVGISLARLNRVIAYEPDDMTVIAEAGLTLGALNGVLATRGQRLPADPPHPERTTLGALVAGAQAGPLRLSEGTVRDLLIGVRFAGHDGRVIHGGGRVVKNVAGYDLMKVMTGSFGTLGIITETIFKVRPLPARYTLALAQFPDAQAAFAAATVLHDAIPLMHLEVVSPAVAVALGYQSRPHVLVGLAGSAEEVAYLVAQATAILGSATEVIADSAALAAYERLRDYEPEDAPLVAQIAVAPAELATWLGHSGAEFRAHAGCGVAQIFIHDASTADELRQMLAGWRKTAREARGHLCVLRVDDDFHGAVQFFDDPPAPALALMRRLKATFDPHAVFNPGCFVGMI
ncbi:MAG TPA: FAD-binding oxidoreductase [Candidatus Binataceae bacterium]|jgi:glycolate oxidase FAD binding subunit|nr:FAD-binding oxidoreductase [Candidatus Binataceae bacterium]